MYNGIGLPTPRGSGTNGYVQKNLAFITNLKEKQQYKTEDDLKHADAVFFKEPNKEILEHERKRKIEVKCFELAEQMEEQGYGATEIEKKVSVIRAKLLEEMRAEDAKKKHIVDTEPLEKSIDENGRLAPKGTHETAAVTALKNAIFKEALGIGPDFQDGNSMEQAKERRKEEAETKRLLEEQTKMRVVDSSSDESNDEKVKSKHHKVKKHHRRTRTPSSGSSSDDGSRSESDSGDEQSRSRKKHKSSKSSHSRKHRHSHHKEKKRRH